jgi:hypothetical protein
MGQEPDSPHLANRRTAGTLGVSPENDPLGLRLGLEQSDRNVAEAIAGWEPAARCKRSSGPTTAATRNQPRHRSLGRLPSHAYTGRAAVVAASLEHR